MKKIILAAMIGAMTLGVNAGDWGKAPVGKAPIEECIDLGGEITVGYMSDYFYRGQHVATGSVYGDVNYTFDGLAIPITIGAWYLNGVDIPTLGPFGFDHLQVYATAHLGTFAGFDLGLSYIHHEFPEGLNPIFNAPVFFGGDGDEVKLDFRRDLGFAALVGSFSYYLGDTVFPQVDPGFYGNIGLEKSIGITDNISLVLAGGVGYADIYSGIGLPGLSVRGWNHYYLTASLPIQLNCRTTLTPYIGYNDQNGTLTSLANPASQLVGALPDGSHLHGGVALSVTF